LSIAARLKALGIKSLIVDRAERVGDNWRNRYHNLVLHDSVWFDHLAYLPFPATWPVHTPKDKMANWLEFYVEVLELNVWTSTTITQSSWDEETAKWTVSLSRNGKGREETRTISPKV
jgi:cation diffusion facilitator CzcD-associated flavoprotein CzcO